MFQVIIVAILALLLGAALCFAGYRLFLVLLPIWGFFAGFWLGAEGVSLLFGGGFLATVTGWVVGFVIGLFGALLSYLFYILGVAIVAAGFGAALGSGFMQAIGFEPGFMVAVVAVISAIIMAGLVVLLNIQKYVIIAITAIGGANAMILSVLLLLGRVSLDSLPGAGSSIRPILQDSWFWLIAWIILAVIGIVAQIRVNRNYTFNREDYAQGWG
jgi:hypothetical protein